MAVRGLHVHNGVLIAVFDSALVSIDSNGVGTVLGGLSSTAGPVDFASLLNQIVITDGALLYVWNGSAVVTVAGYTGGSRLGFVDQRIVFDRLNTQTFGWTALNDATSIDPLDFASAEGATDKLVAAITDHSEVWLFGEYTTEVWNSIGGDEVFARNQSAFIEYGAAAAFSIQKSANSITWLARDENGQAMVLAANGYQPQRVSTRAIEERFDGIDLSQARAYTYSDGPHQFYCLNVPRVDTTLVYDAAFQQWHERAETDAAGNWKQWRPTCHAFAYGRHFFGTEDGDIFEADRNRYTYGSSPLIRSRVMPVFSTPQRNRVSFAGVEIVCDRGTASVPMLRWSDNNGGSFGNWHYASSGAVGQTKQRVRWNRLGSAYDRVFEVRFSDNAPFNPVEASVEAQ